MPDYKCYFLNYNLMYVISYTTLQVNRYQNIETSIKLKTHR